MGLTKVFHHGISLTTGSEIGTLRFAKGWNQKNPTFRVKGDCLDHPAPLLPQLHADTQLFNLRSNTCMDGGLTTSLGQRIPSVAMDRAEIRALPG